MRTENSVEVELVIGLINENRNKIKRQFNMSRTSIAHLEYIYQDMKKDKNLSSYSSIVEQALKAYHSLYMCAKKLEAKK
jgi:hypothetical protein